MKTRNKHLRLLALALAVVAGLTGVLWWERGHQTPPQIITLPDGSRYLFAGVTYSTRNVPPTFVAHFVSWLPTPLAKMAKRLVGKRISQLNEGGKFETPQLFVWFQRLGTNAAASTRLAAISAMLADQSGVEAGVTGFPGFDSGVTWHYGQFPVLPRRSRLLHVTLYHNFNLLQEDLTSDGTVTFLNPLYGHFAQWKAEPVPTVKQAGDLQVRLDSFAAGNPFPGGVSWISMSDSREGYRLATQRAYSGFGWSLTSPRGTNESWVLHAAELSDATGNVLRDSQRDGLLFYSRQPPVFVVFQPALKGTLWPDEAAWRLKLAFKHASGIARGELVTFTNVPVPALGTTNRLFLSQTVGGIEIALTEFVQQPNLTASGAGFNTLSRIKVELPAKSEGVAVDFLETTPGVAAYPELSSYRSGSAYVFYLNSIPTNVPTMYFIFAVQKTRSVEFLVAPPKPK
jgi:hypothetical protein